MNANDPGWMKVPTGPYHARIYSPKNKNKKYFGAIKIKNQRSYSSIIHDELVWYRDDTILWLKHDVMLMRPCIGWKRSS